MNSYRLILFLHIASAALLLGGSTAGILVRSAMRRCSTTREAAAILALGRPLGVMNPASAFALLGTGIYLASVGRWWTMPWVLVAVALWVVNVALAKGAVGPVIERLVERVVGAPDGPISHEVDTLRRSAAWTLGGDLLVSHDLALLLLMTLRLGLVPSLATVALAFGVVLVLAWLRGGPKGAPAPWTASAAPAE